MKKKITANNFLYNIVVRNAKKLRKALLALDITYSDLR